MEFLVNDTVIYLAKYIDARLLFLNKRMYETLFSYVRETYEYHADHIIRDIDIFGEGYPKIIRNFTGYRTDILKNCEIIEIGDMNGMDSPSLDLLDTNIKHLVRSDNDKNEQHDTYFNIIYPKTLETIADAPGDNFPAEQIYLRKIGCKQRLSFRDEGLRSLPRELTHLYTHNSFYGLPEWIIPELPTSITHLSIKVSDLFPKKFPQTITHLSIFDKLDISLDELNLHEGLLFLSLEHYTGNITETSLPESLDEFIIKTDYIGSIDKGALKNIKVLRFGHLLKKQSTNIMPNSLERLFIYNYLNYDVKLPPALKYLNIGGKNRIIDNLPVSLTEFIVIGRVHSPTLNCEFGENLEKIDLGYCKLKKPITIPHKVTELSTIMENLIYLQIYHKLKKLKLHGYILNCEDDDVDDCISRIKTINCDIIESNATNLLSLHNNWNENTNTIIVTKSYHGPIETYFNTTYYYQILPHHIKTIEFTDIMCRANHYKKISFHIKKIIYNSERKNICEYFYYLDRDVEIIQKSNRINYEPEL